MPKRLHDADIWINKQWFRELPVTYKLFWLYIKDRCDIAGIWDIDIKQAEFHIGAKIDIEKALGLLNKHIIILNGGGRIFLKDFIFFQYGELKEKSPIHLKVIEILKKNQLWDKSSNTLLDTLCNRVVDRGKAKEEDKEEVKEDVKAEKLNNIIIVESHFLEIWNLYPRKTDKLDSQRFFFKSVKTIEDFNDIKAAVNNYRNCRQVKEGFIQNGSRWFRNWRDWVNYSETNSSLSEETIKNAYGL